ncbi:MAG: hypothetical protein A3D31_13225 [Candidatus Fluviicola riflensis]|nr:MAG: hypothetical protein CHH17_17660 [Candidatus Fluviicola riflensis]OGS77940.1 MAG: hypothetical protein A3D31_13225 [Candidatus Fluviicola riflensis]OGS85005.1 MAG: hypothetical protein A2724_10160 [Fluviicola sp. RIFCSPHIGHO2_01_FULL_43_53]OGS89277.1 MAG: hypothetical protein A3E30_04465 [Fluviicola sp. RIFCSPHIGHO2_12_FULL_43_24]
MLDEIFREKHNFGNLKKEKPIKHSASKIKHQFLIKSGFFKKTRKKLKIAVTLLRLLGLTRDDYAT